MMQELVEGSATLGQTFWDTRYVCKAVTQGRFSIFLSVGRGRFEHNSQFDVCYHIASRNISGSEWIQSSYFQHPRSSSQRGAAGLARGRQGPNPAPLPSRGTFGAVKGLERPIYLKFHARSSHKAFRNEFSALGEAWRLGSRPRIEDRSAALRCFHYISTCQNPTVW